MKLTLQRVEKSAPIVILGAGLAGLSLADALLTGGHRAPITLVDRRREWGDDRTWCTWLTGPLPYAGLADHRWWAWSVSRAGATHVARTRVHPYVHLRSRALYDDVLARLDAAPDVEIRTGERVLAAQRDGGEIAVTTARETLRAPIVVDAMGVHSPLLARGAGPTTRPLTQRFVGWEVATERPVFDPEVATLMDLRGGDADGVGFLYVLPFAADRALVEHTTIGVGRGPDAESRRAALATELTRRGADAGRGWEVLREEVGAIPMTDRRHPARHPSGALTAGGAAGAIRPSSGYAFTRVQRHTAALSACILHGAPLPPAGGSTRLRVLDAIFLSALADAPDGGAALFWALARHTPADAFARFMTDASTPLDEARIVAALTPRAPSLLVPAARRLARTGQQPVTPR